MTMISRLASLAGINMISEKQDTAGDECSLDALKARKKTITGTMAVTSTGSDKYKELSAELAEVERAIEDAEKEPVKESANEVVEEAKVVDKKEIDDEADAAGEGSFDSEEKEAEKAVKEAAEPTKLDVDGQHVDANGGDAVKVPAEIKTSIATRVKELKASIEEFDKHAYNEFGVKTEAVAALEKIGTHLDDATVDSIKRAQVYFSSLSNAVTAPFPPQLIKWLASAIGPKLNKVNESLGEGEYKVSAVENIPFDEYVKRKPDARKVYQLTGFDKETGKFILADELDISREIYVRPGTQLVWDFTY